MKCDCGRSSEWGRENRRLEVCFICDSVFDIMWYAGVIKRDIDVPIAPRRAKNQR